MQEGKLRGLSMVDLVGRLVNDVSELVEKQIELGRVEARENLFQTISGAKLLVVAALLLLTTWIVLVVAAIFALALLIPGWLSAIVVAIILGIVGSILAWSGKNSIVTNPLARTRESVKENMEWVRHRGSSSAT
ncbi:MAG: phage holin family protein [Chloroflexota bacterium]|nr:MAG: phage holin family protein [Chloroflexota bacterium]